MAAASVKAFLCAGAIGSTSGWPTTLPSTTQTLQWAELDLSTQLQLIARAWLSQRRFLARHSSCSLWWPPAFHPSQPQPETIPAVTLL
ncbi:hypothetical protein F5Y16DRAFT_7625 [Xylariaceae sp. FL0255]|nr:hypothetical protein F5Y16DRAFT_7625 [Xylariaceae sp. FL0255]